MLCLVTTPPASAAGMAEKTTHESEAPWAFVCHASSCRYRGAEETTNALAAALRGKGDGQPAAGTVVRSGCMGFCSSGPVVATYPTGDVHLQVRPSDAPELASQLTQGRTLRRLAPHVPAWYREYLVKQLGRVVEILKRRVASS
jgi:(2Fe-2S) ferredoxin